MKSIIGIAFTIVLFAGCAHQEAHHQNVTEENASARSVSSIGSTIPDTVDAVLALFGGEVSNFKTAPARGQTPDGRSCTVFYSSHPGESEVGRWFEIMGGTGDVHSPGAFINLSSAPKKQTRLIYVRQAGPAAIEFAYSQLEPAGKTDWGWTLSLPSWVTFKALLVFNGHHLLSVVAGQKNGSGVDLDTIPMFSCKLAE